MVCICTFWRKWCYYGVQRSGSYIFGSKCQTKKVKFLSVFRIIKRMHIWTQQDVYYYTYANLSLCFNTIKLNSLHFQGSHAYLDTAMIFEMVYYHDGCEGTLPRQLCWYITLTVVVVNTMAVVLVHYHDICECSLR